jgi:hypothetical protein
MELRSLFEWLDVSLPGATYLRESVYGFAILLSAHVVTMCLFLGLILMMDLRLVGIGNRETPFSELQRSLFPWQMLGMVLVSVTGVLLLYAQPLRYYGKGFFWVKLGMLGLAGANALFFHLTTYRDVARWDGAATPPRAARIAGMVSLAAWAGVVVFGRLVAYSWFTYE